MQNADEALDEAERASTPGEATAAPPDPKQPKGKGVQFIYPSTIPIPMAIGIAKEFWEFSLSQAELEAVLASAYEMETKLFPEVTCKLVNFAVIQIWLP